MEFTSSCVSTSSSSHILHSSSLLLLFGTETGTAESLAYKLGNELRGRGMDCRVCGMDEYDVTDLPNERNVVMIVATAGDGETPANMRSFWRFLLNRALPADSLSRLTVGVFGLGDSSYDKFNAAARRLSVRLKQLGAKHCVPLGLGDDQAAYGYYMAWNDWIAAYLTAIAASVSAPMLELQAGSVHERAHEYSIARHTLAHTDTDTDTGLNAAFYNMARPPGPLLLGAAAGAVLQGRLVENTRLTTQEWHQDVRHLRICIDSGIMRGRSESDSAEGDWFRGGDVAVVYPNNSNELVEAALAIVLAAEPDLTPDMPLYITHNSHARTPHRRTRLPTPTTTTCRALLTSLLDIGGVPHRPFFEELAAYALDNDEREKLDELGSAKGTDLYFDYCVREKKSYVECLGEFPSARPPLVALLELIPILQPRQFSIANSSVVNPTHIDLCVGLLQRRTPYGRTRTGVCSGHLCKLSPGADVRLWLRRGTFRKPALEVPLILVGPGTGVAPMRALLLERIAMSLAKGVSDGGDDGAAASMNVLLFYGCRKQDSDFLYRDEWTSQHGFSTCTDPIRSCALTRIAGGRRFDIQMAFSRDVPVVNGDKPYVTHRIRERGAEVWALMQAGAMIFVAGSANRMPADVKKALRDVAAECGGLSESGTDALLSAMVKRGHYYVEAWS